MTRHYVAAGYLNSGALIPDQAIEDGVVTLRVIEGRLTGLEVTGEHRFRPGFIESRMEGATAPPLNVHRVQERLQLLLQNPQIERINAELVPGTEPGEAALRMAVVEAPRQVFGVVLANSRSPTVGANRVEGQAAFRNPGGRGDALALRAGLTEGTEDAALSYLLPLNARDTLLSLKAETSDMTVVEPPFDVIELRTRSEYWEAGIVHPLRRTLSTEVLAGAALARRSSQTYLLGQPFSFVPGTEDGRTVVSALKLTGDWLDRGTSHVLAARLTINAGLDAMGSTVLDNGQPDSRFVARLAQVQWARRYGAGDQLVLRADIQRANGALPSSEKFAVGGAQSVRGYRENQLVQDNGTVLSAEYRWLLGSFALPGADPTLEGGGPLELAAFLDSGSGYDRPGTRTRLTSLGAGLRWSPVRGSLLQLYKGFARHRPQPAADDLQDRGLHFSAAYQWTY